MPPPLPTSSSGPTAAPIAAASFHVGPRAVLGLRQALALIVGVVIGAGIFKAPAMVAAMTDDVAWMFVAWALGGAMSMAGALCYAELATAYPNAGGDYHFLRRAYGPSLAFLFAWARFSVITTGSIALLAFVLGDYMSQLLPLGGLAPAWSSALYAAAAVLLLTWINLRGIGAGAATQSWLTALEVGGLLLIVAAALFLIGRDDAGVAAAASTLPAQEESGLGSAGMFGMAMVFVLLTYGGWNEAAYISAELKDARRNMVKALVLSIALITALYLLVTWAYWKGLGMTGLAASEAPAADLLRVSFEGGFGPAFGATAEKLISALVAIAALTSINATMIVGARGSYAAGRDWPNGPILAGLGRWDAARNTPVHAMRLQCIVALLLVAVGAWNGNGFKSMVEFTAPVFWLFFLLAGISLFVLRRREPAVERPFKVPLFPLLPLLFCAICAWMLWSSLSYVRSQSLGGWNAAWIGVAVLAVGVVLLALIRSPAAKPSANPSDKPGHPAVPTETP